MLDDEPMSKASMLWCRYKTPLAAEIDSVGITPELSCKTGLEIPGGVPLDPASLMRVAQTIPLDGCVMRAEEQLEATLGTQEALSWDNETNTWAPALQARAPSLLQARISSP